MTLLMDDDPAVHRAMKEEFLRMGERAKHVLRPCLLSPEPLLRLRAREILMILGRQEAHEEFLDYCQSHRCEMELETAIWKFARTGHPEINTEGYAAILDDHAMELRERIDYGSREIHTLKTVNDYLFQHRGYSGDEENYYDPDNSFLHRVIDRRRGNPISLCCIYWLVCRRLGLPVVGVGMPGHFLCRFQSERMEVFVDAFHQGRLLSRKDCVRMLRKHDLLSSRGCFRPSEARLVLRRMCMNLYQIHSKREQNIEMERMKQYLIALGHRAATDGHL